MLKTAATHRKPARVTADVEPPVGFEPTTLLLPKQMRYQLRYTPGGSHIGVNLMLASSG